MYSRPIVKDSFKVPTELVTKNFILRPLTIKYVDKDYEAVMKSVDHLYKLMDDSEWPKEMTFDEILPIWDGMKWSSLLDILSLTQFYQKKKRMM